MTQLKRNSLYLTEIDQDSLEHRVAKSWASSFDKLLYNPSGLHMFAEFLKKEFSNENVFFWVACERYQSTTNVGERKRMAREIFDMYLDPEAKESINVDAQVRKKTEQLLERGPETCLFQDTQKHIYKLMMYDSYPRFLKSDIYKECLRKEDRGEKVSFIPDPALELPPQAPDCPAINTELWNFFHLVLPSKKILNVEGKEGTYLDVVLRPLLLQYGYCLDLLTIHVMNEEKAIEPHARVESVNDKILEVRTRTWSNPHFCSRHCRVPIANIKIIPDECEETPEKITNQLFGEILQSKGDTLSPIPHSSAQSSVKSGEGSSGIFNFVKFLKRESSNVGKKDQRNGEKTGFLKRESSSVRKQNKDRQNGENTGFPIAGKSTIEKPRNEKMGIPRRESSSVSKHKDRQNVKDAGCQNKKLSVSKIPVPVDNRLTSMRYRSVP